MFHLKKKIPARKHSDYFIRGDEVYYVDNDNNLSKYNLKTYKKEILYKSKYGFQFIAAKKDFFIFRKSFGKYVIFNADEELNQDLENLLSQYDLNPFAIINSGLYVFKGTYGNKTEGIFDFRHKRILWSQSYNTNKIFQKNDFLFAVQNENGANCKIICLLYRDGSKMWECDITDLPKNGDDLQINSSKNRIKNIVGIFKDVLMISIDNIGIVGISINSGKINWIIRKISNPILGNIETNVSIGSVPEFFLSRKDQLYYALLDNCFYKIDLENLSLLIVKDFREDYIKSTDSILNIQDKLREATQKAYKFNNTVSDGEYLYFIGKKDNNDFIASETIGAFNMNTKSIDWDYQLVNSAFPNSRKPIINNHYLAALDYKGFLCIYGK